MIQLTEQQPDWALGFLEETWWSRLARPALPTWVDVLQPLRLVEQAVAKDDPAPKALAGYGLLVRCPQQAEQVWLRFVDGRPVSAVTTQFLAWCCTKLEALSVRVWALIWDNASWHVSRAVRAWIRRHNRQVKQQGQGVRILSCCLTCRSRVPGSTPSSPSGSMASAPPSSLTACSPPTRSRTAPVPISAVPMKVTSFRRKSVDCALGCGLGACLGHLACWKLDARTRSARRVSSWSCWPTSGKGVEL